MYNSLWSAGLLLTHSKPVAWCGCVPRKQPVQHATAIPSRTYPFSSDQGSQTGLGSTSTRLSDRPGTLSAVVSFVFMPACCIYTVCSAQNADCLPKCERCPTHSPRLPCCIFTLARNNNQLLAKLMLTQCRAITKLVQEVCIRLHEA